MRSIRAGAVLGVVLALAAGTTAAHALWGVRTALPAGVSATGDMTVSAAWSPAAPSWAAVYPGESRTATLVVTQGGSADTTLRWTLRASGAVAAVAAGYASVQLWAGSCGTGTLLYSPAGGSVTYPASGSLAPGASVSICAQVTLSASAPAGAQNAALAPTIAVTANQKGP